MTATHFFKVLARHLLSIIFFVPSFELQIPTDFALGSLPKAGLDLIGNFSFSIKNLCKLFDFFLGHTDSHNSTFTDLQSQYIRNIWKQLCCFFYHPCWCLAKCEVSCVNYKWVESSGASKWTCWCAIYQHWKVAVEMHFFIYLLHLARNPSCVTCT